ncbi:MAG: D-sedoheptulose 7-phosphate isomerase [Terracidiphilus sp.]|jgi:D-sedoheptulose 7-phosphate isomerase
MHKSFDVQSVFGKAIRDHLEVAAQLEGQLPVLEEIGLALTAALRGGGKILWCGNGGSAADSQHLAAELVGRFRRERRGLASISLTTDTSILTCVANDFGFDSVFSRQVEAIGSPGDLLMALSTSGNSRNVIAALEAARAKGLTSVALTGMGGGKMAQLADYVLSIESADTARIQEVHILAGHMLCDWVEMDCVRPLDPVAPGETAR